MTRIALAFLALTACVAPASGDPVFQGSWQLAALDGATFPASATLTIEDSGNLGGRAPCNGWSARKAARLPELALQGIMSTEMACDALAEEGRFFRALAKMDTATLPTPDELVLTGPGGRSMTFTRIAGGE